MTDEAAEAAAARRGAKPGAAPLLRMDSKQRTVLVPPGLLLSEPEPCAAQMCAWHAGQVSQARVSA